MERYQFYKSKEVVNNRKARKELILNNRKDQRLQRLEELRQINKDISNKEPPKVEGPKKKSRLEILKEWKLEKAQKENLLKQAKKPPFYVGKVHTKASGSPKLTSTSKQTLPTRTGVVTRSQAKASNASVVKPIETTRKKRAQKIMKLEQLNKVEKNVLRPVENHSFLVPKAVAALSKLTIPQSPKITKSARKSVRPLFDNLVQDASSSTASNQLEDKELYVPKAKRMLLIPKIADEPIQKSDSILEDAPVLAAAIEADNVDKIEYTPDNSPRLAEEFQHLAYSPFIEKERGDKRASRRSSKKSITVSEEIQAEETVRQSKIAAFRLFLRNETKRLLDLAETWTNTLSSSSGVPEDVEGDINAAAGKTKLLTSDKFKQFEDLINKCEGGDAMIKVDDLEGFHDWVSLEIEDLDKAFARLEERKNNQWVELNVPEIEKPIMKKKPKITKPAVKRNVPSSMRVHIMAARKQMQKPEDLKEKKVCTPRLATPETPRNRSDLRIQVLQRCSGLAMLAATASARASLSPNKSPNTDKLENTVPMTPPTKSILKKKTPDPTSEKRKVNFPKYLLPAEDSSDELPPFELDLPTQRSDNNLPKYLLPAEDSNDELPDLETPRLGVHSRSPWSTDEEISRQKVGNSQKNKRVSLAKMLQTCLLPSSESSDDSPVGLRLVDKTPRRSARIARKSATPLPKF